MNRKTDWRKELVAYLSSVNRADFKAGQHDCALFAAGAVKVMTGEDLAKGWRGKYRSLKRGRELLKQNGFADHIELAASLLEEVPPIMAQVGDIAVVEENGERALGVVQGAWIWVVRVESGLGRLTLTDAKRAFRV